MPATGRAHGAFLHTNAAWPDIGDGPDRGTLRVCRTIRDTRHCAQVVILNGMAFIWSHSSLRTADRCS